MVVQQIVYLYAGVCISVILFNVFFTTARQMNESQMTHRNARLGRRVRRQMEFLLSGKGLSKWHVWMLKQRLQRLSGMRIFTDTMDGLFVENPGRADMYMKACLPVFETVSRGYGANQSMQKAYFAYLMKKYDICASTRSAVLMNAILTYVAEGSLYCRQNAMAALYDFGNAEKIGKALHYIDRMDQFHHPKLLTDGLLAFRGNHEELMELLWNEFGGFKPEMKVAILNYIRMKKGDFSQRFFSLLSDASANKEVRIAVIRYFAARPFPPARGLLIQLLESRAEGSWESAAVAATALASYPGRETEAALKEALHSSDWYVRYNAARSLIDLGLGYAQLADIMNGKDRFAREMLLYFMQHDKLQEEGGRSAAAGKQTG